MQISVTNIDWDWDGKHDGEPCPEHLPTELVIDDPELVPKLSEDIDGYAENLADYLSDTYEYCVCGFVAELEKGEAS